MEFWCAKMALRLPYSTDLPRYRCIAGMAAAEPGSGPPGCRPVSGRKAFGWGSATPMSDWVPGVVWPAGWSP